MTATRDRPDRPADVHAGSGPPSEVAGPATIVPLLVTVPQAARALSIGRTALYQLIWDGQLTPIHIGRSVRFSVVELARFVESRLESPR